MSHTRARVGPVFSCLYSGASSYSALKVGPDDTSRAVSKPLLSPFMASSSGRADGRATTPNLLVPTNLLGEAVPHRLAMGLPPSVPVELKGRVAATAAQLRSSGGLRHRPQRFNASGSELGRFANSHWLQPSTVGGNPARLSASDASLLASASLPPDSLARYRPPQPRARNPITGDVPKPPPPPAAMSMHSPFGSRPFIFPARGTIGSIGSASSRPKTPQARKLEYSLWCEAQRRASAERELRQVQIHGRSRPPWIGDCESSGYRQLYPQSR